MKIAISEKVLFSPFLRFLEKVPWSMLKLEKSRKLVPNSDYFGAEEFIGFSMGAKNRSKKAVFTPPNIYAKNAKNVSGHLFFLVYPPCMTKLAFCKCILIRYCLDMAWLPPFLAGSKGRFRCQNVVFGPKSGFWRVLTKKAVFDQKSRFWPNSGFQDILGPLKPGQ